MINFTARIKNKTFWLTLIPAVLLLAQVVAAPFGYQWDFGVLNEQLAAIINALFAVLAILGIVTDPTTAGVGDSAQALTYTEPKREEGYAAAEEDRLAIVVDRPIAEGNSMPLWLQTDPQWDYIPYAGGTIGDHGCGLTCAAMAVKYMTLQDITPLTLASFVGDTCLTDGVNDPGKFCAWIAEHYPEYGIESTPISYDLAPVLQNVSDGWLAFAGMSGTLGDRDYGGHVVLIWRADDDGYWIRDPASAGNSARAFTLEELEQVDFHYFYCIRGGFYGTQRH